MTKSMNEVEAGPPRRRMSGWVRLVISVMFLATLVIYVDLVESWQVIRSAQPAFIALLFIFFVGLRFLSAYRLFVLLHGKNTAITFRKILRVTFVSLFLGSFMVGGTELARVYFLSKTTSDWALTVSSTIVERTLALLALFLLLLTALLAEPPGVPSIFGHLAWLGLVLLTLGALLFMSNTWRKMIDRLLSKPWLSAIRHGLGKIYVHLDAYINQPWLLIWSLVLAFTLQFVRVGITAFGAWVLGVQLPLMTFLVIVPIIILIVLIPISVGGLGVRETAFVSLFSLVGVSAEEAFTLSLLLFVIGNLSNLPGAYFYVFERSAKS